MRTVVLAACAAAACGRIGFTAGGGSAGGDGGGGDGGGSGDGGSSDAMITTSSVCPGTVALFDDFSTATTQSIWTPFSAPGITYAQVSGYLEISFATSTVPSGNRTGYDQATAIDYTESCTIVELDTVPNTASAGVVNMQIGGSDFVQFEETSNELIMNRKGGVLGRPAYDATADRFRRLRSHAGTWYWDTSPDGVTFTTRASVVQTIIAPAILSLDCIASTGVQNGGKADFNSVTVVVPP